MPAFELNGKKVSYGFAQEDGSLLVNTKDAVEALGYPSEVANDLLRGHATDVRDEIDHVLDKEFGPDEREIQELPTLDGTIRVCGPERDDSTILEDDKVCLSDIVNLLAPGPYMDERWVSAGLSRQFLLTRLAATRSRPTMLDGVRVRCMSHSNKVLYSVNDIVAEITKEPLVFDEGWRDEEEARQLIKTLRAT